MNEPAVEEPLDFETTVSDVKEPASELSQSPSLYSGESSSMERERSICNSKDVLFLLP